MIASINSINSLKNEAHQSPSPPLHFCVYSIYLVFLILWSWLHQINIPTHEFSSNFWTIVLIHLLWLFTQCSTFNNLKDLEPESLGSIFPICTRILFKFLRILFKFLTLSLNMCITFLIASCSANEDPSINVKLFIPLYSFLFLFHFFLCAFPTFS